MCSNVSTTQESELCCPLWGQRLQVDSPAIPQCCSLEKEVGCPGPAGLFLVALSLSQVSFLSCSHLRNNRVACAPAPTPSWRPRSLVPPLAR